MNTVVYFTRSIHPQENELLIKKVVDELVDSSDDCPFRLVPVDTAVRDSLLSGKQSFYEPLVNMKNVHGDTGMVIDFEDKLRIIFCDAIKKVHMRCQDTTRRD